MVIGSVKLKPAAGDHDMVAGRLCNPLSIVLLSVTVTPLLAKPSQLQPCPPAESLLTPTNPAYPDAQDLARVLREHGFVVRCIFPSKFGSMFQVGDGGVMRSTIEGEAVYITSFGSIDAVFATKPQNFYQFNITETPQRSGHMYLLSGTPHVVTNQFGSAYPQYFLKNENKLLIVDDKRLRDRLKQIFGSSQKH